MPFGASRRKPVNVGSSCLWPAARRPVAGLCRGIRATPRRRTRCGQHPSSNERCHDHGSFPAGTRQEQKRNHRAARRSTMLSFVRATTRAAGGWLIAGELIDHVGLSALDQTARCRKRSAATPPARAAGTRCQEWPSLLRSQIWPVSSVLTWLSSAAADWWGVMRLPWAWLAVKRSCSAVPICSGG